MLTLLILEHKLGQSMMKNSSIQFINNLISNNKELLRCKESIVLASQMLVDCYKSGNKVMICGNGGSASDAEHIVGELMKSFCKKRPISEDLKMKIADDNLSSVLEYGLPTISLVSQTSLISAFSNDKMPAAAYAQQVLGYANKGDILLAISTSGNSLNCVYAAKVAKALEAKVISLTGSKNSDLSAISDLTIMAPATETYKIQEYHLPIYHTICLIVENELFDE